MTHYTIHISYSDEYKLYSARCADLPGMFVDCPTLQELCETLTWAVPIMAQTTTSELKEDMLDISIPLHLMQQFSEHRIK